MTAKTETTIRAIHIDPFKCTVKEIAAPNDFERMKAEILLCDMAEPLSLGEGALAWVDEEGLLKDWDAQGFSLLAGFLTLAGHVLIVGAGEGEGGELLPLPDAITLQEVQNMVQFIPAKKVRIPGKRVTTFNEKNEPVTEYVGPRFMTYKNH